MKILLFHINFIIFKHWQLLKTFQVLSQPNKAHLWADMAGGLPATSGIGNGRRWSELKYGMKAPGLLIDLSPAEIQAESHSNVFIHTITEIQMYTGDLL